MSNLEKLVRRRMQEEYEKGTSAERISQLIRKMLNNTDIASETAHAMNPRNGLT
jgi:hypothetical protein